MAEIQNEQEIKEKQSTDKFPCKSCGGNMAFDPESSSLSCTYCGNKVEISNETAEIKEYDFRDAEANVSEDWGSETRVIKCDSCGAETVLGAGDAAQFCAFCGSSHIVKDDKTAGIAPESVIPFKITEKSAKQLFVNWIKKRYLAPKALKTSYQGQRLKGVYIPCWTYDSETSSTYTAEGGTYYYVSETRTVTENGKQVVRTQQVRHVRWWPTSGTYSKYFDDVPVNASKNIDAGLMTKLEPFDRKELLHYKPEYLSGFLAERYSIGLKEGWELACKIIDKEIQVGIRKQINADEVRNLRINSFYNNIKYKLTLLPLWISAYTFKNKAYTFMVNGQTGKVSGHAPLSPLKIILIAGVGIAVIVLGYLLLHK
jgi:predicted RNA-binding Zn-ribbon protein involved in translation (DUF1610 family)